MSDPQRRPRQEGQPGEEAAGRENEARGCAKGAAGQEGRGAEEEVLGQPELPPCPRTLRQASAPRRATFLRPSRRLHWKAR